ncbi:MAG: glycosyltransferase [Tannerella sp.]|jgi:hypothetical protein|nr:glycosyltransferase [Tannerella sp.]
MEKELTLHKKILYIAVHEYNKGWGAEHFVNKGFIDGGNKTICIDYRKYRKGIVNQIKTVEPFDYFLLQRGDFFPIKILKAINRPKFFWASELVSRNRDQDRLLQSKLFDHVFVHTQACKKAVIANNWLKEEQISVLLNGFDPEIHYPMENIEKDIDVLFIGNMLNRRKKWLNEIKKHCSLYIVNGVYGEDMVKMVNRSRIILNIHSEEFLDTETRLFEVLGCRGFLLSEKLSEDNPFINNKHLVECIDLSDMISKIRYYLNHENEVKKIAEQGYVEAINKHTYKKRAEYLTDFFSKYENKNIQDSICVDILNSAKSESFILYMKVYFSEKLMALKRYVKRLLPFCKFFLNEK